MVWIILGWNVYYRIIFACKSPQIRVTLVGYPQGIKCKGWGESFLVIQEEVKLGVLFVGRDSKARGCWEREVGWRVS